MTSKDYSLTVTVSESPEQVFAAINDVRGWWSGEIVGATDQLGAEFTYRVEGVHFSKQRVTELVPGRRIVWHVTEARLSFVKSASEWEGTDIVFEIAKKGDGSELRFTHKGLSPAFECHDRCSDAWGTLVRGNLRNLIATGEPQPSPW